jgi:hypothetical protein
MPEESRGFAIFGGNNWWIWIAIIVIVLLSCNSGSNGFGYSKD